VRGYWKIQLLEKKYVIKKDYRWEM
jgi:hypothetical protein